MSRVEIPAPGDVVQDTLGNVLAGRSVTLKLAGTATVVTHYSALTAGTSTTGGLVTSSAGKIVDGSGNVRYIDSGAAIDMTVAGVTRRLEPLAASVDGDVAVIKESPLNLAESRFGLVNGASIDTPLTTAFALVPSAKGGEILIPAGAFTSSAGFPVFDDRRNITIQGMGGAGAGAQATTQITYTGTGSRIISARSTTHFKLQDVQLLYNNAGFAGDVIDFGHSAGLGTDSAYQLVERCYLGGSGVGGASSLLNLVRAISGAYRDTVFGRAAYGVRGLTATVGDYSIEHSFDSCTFIAQTTKMVAAAGESWSFNGCTFENLQDGSCGAYHQDQGTALGLTFEGCWFGDGNTLGTWLFFAGHGLNVKGNRFGNGAIGVRCGAGAKACVVTGNTFDTVVNGIRIDTSVSGQFWPNRYTTVTTPILDNGTLANSTLGITASGTNGDDNINLTGRVAAPQGIHIMTKAGIPTDADFPSDRAPLTGLIGCVDTTNSRLYVRVGSTWKFTALT